MTGSFSGPSSQDGGIRKKMRKGTHSCFECRRRKIRCVYSAENQSVCNECFARGSKCIDQEHAESDVVLDQRKNLRERVAKLESLVETLLDDKSDTRSAAEALKKLGAGDFPSPHSQHSNHDSPRASITVPERINTHTKDAPLLSLFDNAVLSRVESKLSTASSIASPGQGPNPESILNDEQRAWQVDDLEDEPSDHEVMRLKKERIFQILMKALPPAHTMQGILQGNDHWWEMFKHKCPGIIGPSKSLEDFAARCLSAKDPQPASLGTLVLCVASCYPDRGEALEKALELVEQHVTNDDDLTCSIEGLECCMLQGKCYSDIGQARKAWRTFRRAITSAQVMGLHRNHRASPETEMMWWNLYMGDRMCSLMLGLPYAISDAHIDMTVRGKDISGPTTPETFMLKGAQIAGQVTDRLLSAKPATFSSAMELDQVMDKMVQDLEVVKFWDIPAATTIRNSKDLVDWQVNVLSQIMFHQIRAYLHMPFMLQSATNKRYEYSRKATLEASREMLRLYHMLRLAGYSVYQCKVVDFIGFTANIILMLGLLGYGRVSTPHDPEQDESDWKLIETSIDIFKVASSEKGGKVAQQSYQTLKDFHQIRGWEGKGEYDGSDSECPPDHKIAIPYFGTISFRRGKKFHHVPTPNAPAGTPCSSTPQLNTPASTTASSFHRSDSSATSPSVASHTNYPAQHQAIKASEQNVSTMDPFISYDAGFWNAPHFSGSFDAHQFNDEPLSNYMSPTLTNQSAGSAASSAANGLDWNMSGGNPAMNGGFPWGNVANMDIDQDWNSFMNDMQQTWPVPNTANQPQLGLI